MVFLTQPLAAHGTQSKFSLEPLVDINLGFITGSSLRFGTSGITVGYVFSSPYPITVQDFHFSVTHHSLYDEGHHRVTMRNEMLKPLLKLPHMLLMKYGELGVLGLSVNTQNSCLHPFMNMV